MKSIKNKILVVVITGLLIMTAAVSAVCFTTMHDILHKDADRILENRSKMEAAQINDIMNDIEKSVIIMEHFATTELFSHEALKVEQYLEDYLEKMEDMFDEVALNTEGAVAFHFRITPEISNSNTGFYKGIVTYNGVKKFESYKPTDLSKYSREDVAYVGWYYTAIDAGQGTWMEPYKNRKQDGWLVSYVAPFYVDQELVGTIGMDIDFSYFLRYVNNIKLYENGKTMLLTPDGKSSYIESGIESIKNIDLKAHAKVPLENGMSLLLSADYIEIQKELRPVLFQVVATFIVIMVIFIILAILTTNKIVAPLKKLTHAAEHLLDGDEVPELPKNSNDEIGKLSVVLSDAYQKITEYMNYINALAYRDSLTGINNTTSYNEAVAQFDLKINLGNPQFAVLVLDINYLKQTNDKYGHDVGNELIRHTTKILCDTFKTSPVYRVGGDEFVVILENKDYENYRELIEKFDDSCANDFVSYNDEKIMVSVARGVAVYNPEVDKVYADVFNNADHAMYMHKEDMKKTLTQR